MIEKYIRQSHMMQIATVDDDQPWVATVYFVSNDELNLYWASPEDTSHSRHISKNQKVAVAIPVHHKKNQPVVGVQISGLAEKLNDVEAIRQIAKIYAQKYDFSEKWIDKVCNKQTKHKLYRFTPDKFVLFDDINYPDNPRQEWTP